MNCKVWDTRARKICLLGSVRAKYQSRISLLKLRPPLFRYFWGVEGLSGTFVGRIRKRRRRRAEERYRNGNRSGKCGRAEHNNCGPREYGRSPTPSFDTQRQNHRKIEAVSLGPTVLSFL